MSPGGHLITDSHTPDLEIRTIRHELAQLVRTNHGRKVGMAAGILKARPVDGLPDPGAFFVTNR
jgi:hypothetical protein